jgi:hypothetical protein
LGTVIGPLVGASLEPASGSAASEPADGFFLCERLEPSSLEGALVFGVEDGLRAGFFFGFFGTGTLTVSGAGGAVLVGGVGVEVGEEVGDEGAGSLVVPVANSVTPVWPVVSSAKAEATNTALAHAKTIASQAIAVFLMVAAFTIPCLQFGCARCRG